MGAGTHRLPLASAACHAASADRCRRAVARAADQPPRRRRPARRRLPRRGRRLPAAVVRAAAPPDHGRRRDDALRRQRWRRSSSSWSSAAALGMVLGRALVPADPRAGCVDERAPTAAERSATLAIAAALLDHQRDRVGRRPRSCSSRINAPVSVELACHVAESILLGGLTCVALGYLLTERIMRPLTARALAYGPVAPRRPGVKGRLVLDVGLRDAACRCSGSCSLGVRVLADPAARRCARWRGASSRSPPSALHGRPARHARSSRSRWPSRWRRCAARWA